MSAYDDYKPESDEETKERWKPRVSVTQVDQEGRETFIGFYHFQYLPRIGEDVLLPDPMALCRYVVVGIEHHAKKSGEAKLLSPGTYVRVRFVKFDRINE